LIGLIVSDLLITLNWIRCLRTCCRRKIKLIGISRLELILGKARVTIVDYLGGLSKWLPIRCFDEAGTKISYCLGEWVTTTIPASNGKNGIIIGMSSGGGR
jgi:hypothetical protein